MVTARAWPQSMPKLPRDSLKMSHPTSLLRSTLPSRSSSQRDSASEDSQLSSSSSKLNNNYISFNTRHLIGKAKRLNTLVVEPRMKSSTGSSRKLDPLQMKSTVNSSRIRSPNQSSLLLSLEKAIPRNTLRFILMSLRTPQLEISINSSTSMIRNAELATV